LSKRNKHKERNEKFMADEDLIQGCIREDRECQALLYEKYGDKMFGVCLRYTKTREEAEDVFQDAFVKILNKISSYKHTGSFEGWMRRIMVNTALRSKDKRALKYEVSDIEDVKEPAFDQQLLANMEAKTIVGLISELPDGYQVVFNLFAIEGYSHKEIAEKLGVTESTSRTQYLRARKALQEKLEAIGIAR
jgi:RNA polymerase sigma factor (sigma-70 family)